ncbi:lipase maturation factor 1-like isoform X3 [Porites lutea]|uniref:lipase maturation factor 1-like isoform X3 n=1 Tax=Porites lutea TaxID=51062 RepID=UPI003CC5C829
MCEHVYHDITLGIIPFYCQHWAEVAESHSFLKQVSWQSFCVQYLKCSKFLSIHPHPLLSFGDTDGFVIFRIMISAVILIISGNLGFLNWLTIVPSLMSFDDKSLAFLFSSSSAKNDVIKIQQFQKAGAGPRPTWGLCVRRVFEVMLGIMVAYLSIPVVQNLLSSRQAMNTSFDSFRIVNTYVAFGSVTKERTEVIFQGTRNLTIFPDHKGGIWEENQFQCKPGDPKRRPCVISPYHYRLDWLTWFAAFQNYQYNPWLIHFATKLLVNDEQATSLIAHNPFINGYTSNIYPGRTLPLQVHHAWQPRS